MRRQPVYAGWLGTNVRGSDEMPQVAHSVQRIPYGVIGTNYCSGAEVTAIQPKSIAIVGAAETTRLGVIPDMSQIQLHADAALNAMADAGLKPADIDGIATAGETPVTVAHYLGLTPKWVDGTAVGGCSFMIHVRHAAAAIASGLCETVLITHGESGRSGVGRTRNVVAPTSLAGQFEQPYGPMGPPTLFTIPVLRYMKTYGLTHEQLAMVSVVQREWAARNPRATFKTPITVEDVLNSRMIAYPFRLLQCCLVTDGGGVLILVAAERARYFPQKPVYLLGTGESARWRISPPRAPSASPAPRPLPRPASPTTTSTI